MRAVRLLLACAAGMMLAAAPGTAAPTPPAPLRGAAAAPMPKPGPHRAASRAPRLPPAPLPLPRPRELAAPPVATQAPVPPPAPATPPPDAAEIAACRATFADLGGVILDDAAADPPADGACAISGPVTFSHLRRPEGPDIALESPITVRCTLAVELARWIGADLAAIATANGTTLAKLTGVGGHACRPRNGQAGAQISEHASGNAFDLLGLTFADGREIALWQADPATREIRAAVQKSACARFRTVLGPGADSSHANHVHLDMRQRRADFAMCQWTVD
ncbi:extensin family protein [Azorhizobium sp. AG788]|uniref:extensin-like domain-containing protein n=1 Tax=Azorhizobium sp. AG788 TaxID=2183897 RepID=UPI0031393F71